MDREGIHVSISMSFIKKSEATNYKCANQIKTEMEK
jgi:hypothetical protein